MKALTLSCHPQDQLIRPVSAGETSPRKGEEVTADAWEKVSEEVNHRAESRQVNTVTLHYICLITEQTMVRKLSLFVNGAAGFGKIDTATFLNFTAVNTICIC